MDDSNVLMPEIDDSGFLLVLVDRSEIIPTGIFIASVVVRLAGVLHLKYSHC